MILNQAAVQIGQKLSTRHNLRLVEDSKSVSDHFPNLMRKSTAFSGTPKEFSPPRLITERELIQSLKSVLSECNKPLGMLGVSEESLCLCENPHKTEFSRQHNKALKIIKDTSPWMYQLVCTSIKAFIPISCPKEYSKAGFSSDFAKGFTFYAYSEDIASERTVFEMAVDYVHEASHQLAFLLNDADPIFLSDQEAPVYSGIKQKERPAILALHGAIALGYMCLFRLFHFSAHGDFVFDSETKLKKDKEKLEETLLSLKNTSAFTKLGNKIIEDLEYIVSLLDKRQ